MKNNKRSAIVIFALASLAMLVFSCITFNTSIFPAKAYINEPMEVNGSFDLAASTEGTSTLLVAFPVPKAWDASSSVSATYSTSGLTGAKTPVADIVNETMTLAGEVTEPTTSTAYATALANKYDGTIGNTEEMEWIVLQGSSVVAIASDDKVKVTIAITVNAGGTPVEFKSAMFAGMTGVGFGDIAGNAKYGFSDIYTINVKERPKYAEFESAAFAEPVYAGEMVEANADINITYAHGGSGKVLFAMPIPASWDTSDELTVTYTSTGASTDVTDEAMTIAGTVTEPVSGSDYASALAAKYGTLENTEEMQWLVMAGSSSFTFEEGSQCNYKFNVKTRAADEVVSFNTAAVICLEEVGFANLEGDDQFGISATSTVTMQERVYPFSVSMSPAAFSFKDYVAVQLNAESGCEVYGENEVYMHSSCTLSDGTVASGPDVVMVKQTDAKYFKYIYPLDFYGVGEDAEISSIHVWFSTKDGSKVAKYYKDDAGFEITEAE